MLWAALPIRAPLREVEAMIVIILIALVALIGAFFSVYLFQSRPAQNEVDPVLPARRFDGLFEAEAPADNQQETGERRRNLLDRAGRGDLNTLGEARQTGDSALYSDVLDALVDWAVDRQEYFEALVSHVSKSNELRANKRLAQRVIENWKLKAAPGRRSTVEMIHIAALSDDTETYAQAIEATMDLWRRGYLTQLSTEEMVELFVSQFWVIAPEARHGGGGYALKRKLLGLRRELASATPVR
jgi:hypothetical protein